MASTEENPIILELRNKIYPYLHQGDSNYLEFAKASGKMYGDYLDRLALALNLSPNCFIIVDIVTTILIFWEECFAQKNFMHNVKPNENVKKYIAKQEKFKRLFQQKKVLMQNAFSSDMKLFCAFIYLFNVIVHNVGYRIDNIFLLIGKVITSDYKETLPYYSISATLNEQFNYSCEILCKPIEVIDQEIQKGLYPQCFVHDLKKRVQLVERYTHFELMVTKVVLGCAERNYAILKYLPENIKSIFERTLLVSVEQDLIIEQKNELLDFNESITYQKVKVYSADCISFYSFLFEQFAYNFRHCSTYLSMESMIKEHPLEQNNLGDFCLFRLRSLTAVLTLITNDTDANRRLKVKNYKEATAFLDKIIMNITIAHRNELDNFPIYWSLENNNEPFFIHTERIKEIQKKAKKLNVVSLSIYSRQKIRTNLITELSTSMLLKQGFAVEILEPKEDNLYTFLKDLHERKFSFKCIDDQSKVLIYDNVTKGNAIPLFKSKPLMDFPDLSTMEIQEAINQFHIVFPKAVTNSQEELQPKLSSDVMELVLAQLKHLDKWNIGPLATCSKIVEFYTTLTKHTTDETNFPEADVMLPIVGYWLKKEAEKFVEESENKMGERYLFENLVMEIGDLLLSRGIATQLQIEDECCTAEETDNDTDDKYDVALFISITIKNKLLLDHGFAVEVDAKTENVSLS